MNRLYGNRNFILIISGKFVSLLGTAVYDIGLMWHFLSEYGEKSGGMLAWIMVLGILPSVFFGLFVGSLIDRFNKKYIMIISDLIAGFTILVATITLHFDTGSSICLLVATGLISLTSSSVSIAVNSMIPEIFENNDLYKVNSINQFVERGTMFAGFSIGGALVGIFGVEKIFLFNAFSFVVSAVSASFISYRKPEETHNKPDNMGFISDFKEVAEFIKMNRNLFRITLLFSIVNFLWDPLFTIVLPYALKNNFSVTSTQFGILQAALPIGFCIGAVFFSIRKSFLENKHVLFYSILCLNSLLTLLFIPILFSDLFSGRIYTVFILFIITVMTGVFSASINISASVAIQTCVPEGMLGKYWAFSRSLAIGLVPVGASIMGVFLDDIPTWVFFVISIVLVYSVIVCIPKDSYSVRNKVTGMGISD